MTPVPAEPHRTATAEGAEAVRHVDEAVAVRPTPPSRRSRRRRRRTSKRSDTARPRHTRTVPWRRRRRACRRSAAPRARRSRRPPRCRCRSVRRRRGRRSSGSGDRAAAAGSASAKPPETSSGGKMPWASARSSAIAAWTSPLISSIIAIASAGSSSTASRARRSFTASATRCCWAPSWRLRSSLRRSASPAATMRGARLPAAPRCACCSSSQAGLEGGVELHVVQRRGRPGGRAR